jgi:hypothetical protein
MILPEICLDPDTVWSNVYIHITNTKVLNMGVISVAECFTLIQRHDVAHTISLFRIGLRASARWEHEGSIVEERIAMATRLSSVGICRTIRILG